ncbi:acyl-CoA dehydrogenase family protein [Streptomyces sp. NPDC001255]|uniref:acyl-CoA dehydrogenase family protein n=1 Tax=Streptomyces sp. NPDC001255 TaxID=3364550 RepID=UPI0036BEC7C4
MDLLPSEEQLELIGAATDFLDARPPVGVLRARRGEPCAVDPAQWAEGAGVGLLTLGLDERYGGLGRPLDDEALLFHALGKRLAPGPYLACVLATRLAARRGDSALAAEIGEGRALVGLAEARGEAAVGPEGVKGTFDLVDASGAEHLLVLSDEGAALIATPEAGRIETVEALDPGMRLASTTLDHSPVLHWLPAGDDPLRGRALALNSALLAGVAEATAELATEHAKNRVQFGRPIGVNQAVKHACADMAVRAEAAVSQTLFAAVALASGRADALFQLLSAKTVAGRAAIDNAAACIQLHGGMGFTDEHDAHLYLKRAHALHHLFIEPADVLARLLSEGAAQ